MTKLLIALVFAWILFGCQSKREQRSSMSNAFESAPKAAEGQYDLDNIRQSGELIIATMPGPTTYFDYHGLGMGRQYVLAEDFANAEGLKVRVVQSPDTAALVQMLVKGEADILALPIPTSTISANGLRAAGVVDAATKQSWAVKKNASQLAEALNQWFSPELLTKLDLTTEERIKKLREVKRTMQAVYLSPSRGIISVYDNLFKKASAETGWDWRLIAAQAYQESGFDPNARSWAGAQGLMQLMPATARSVGVDPSEVFQPEKNVAGASKYLVLLNKQFSDIQDARERIKFVLAAYNGGAGHIRDAMALARKYGKNPIYWREVAPFVLALQKPEFYRDPVVRYGYLIGTETESYVRAILERYQSYGGHVMLERAAAMPFDRSSSSVSATNEPQQTPMVKNKYSSGTPILSPDDPEFNQMDNAAMSK